MNREEIIAWAREAGIAYRARIEEFNSPLMDGVNLDDLAKFAALVAKHTLANIDPSSFMSWQEGYNAGAAAERERFADECIDLVASYGGPVDLEAAIRARGQA